ncbi:hypothetical protein C1645_875637 [Glomus cerebriforme]|uniref:G-protein coupled receptors family 1 profile domain-containing protein n=1 Tax=Glomus cerebriforme TaxID=658196 RepID=A0A397SYI4_9GLOM|nr:hypothetical protein C1645_875637 [Glomus cerebriforme]
MISIKFFINYPFISIIILLLLFFEVLADDQLRSPDNILDFQLIVSFSMTLIIFGLFGCVYIFYRIYKQWISNKKLAMTYRLPFYTACTDFLIDCNFFINMLYTAIYAQVWEDPVCKIIGALNWVFLTINLCLYAVIAIVIQLINIQHYGKRQYWCATKSGQNISAILLFSTIIIFSGNITNK